MARRLLLCWVVLTFVFSVTCQQPQIVKDIFPEVKRKGETGYLNCTVSRQQSNKVYWIRPLDAEENWISSDTEILAKDTVVNGKQKYEIIRTYRGNDRTTYTLMVNRLREEDSGRYKCTIYLVGKDQSLWPYKYGNMTVQVPPTIDVSQTSNTQEGTQGSIVALRCNATGTPTPNITWIRADGKPLPDGRLSHRGHVLSLTNIKRNDGGVYRCLADNNVIPPAQHDAKLVVFFKPEAMAVQDTVGQAQNRRFHALLECRTRGNPAPYVRWLKQIMLDSMILSDDEKYEMSHLRMPGRTPEFNYVWHSLKIVNVQANDYAMYVCEATNSLGSSRANITLYETNECQGPDCPTAQSTTSIPFSRTPAYVENITETSAVLLIDMRDPPTQLVSTGYRIQCEESPNQRLVLNIDIARKDASWGNGTARFSVSGLSPGQVYICQASSRTAFGPGWTEQFSFMTRQQEVAVSPLGGFKWQYAVGISGLSVLLLLGLAASLRRVH